MTTPADDNSPAYPQRYAFPTAFEPTGCRARFRVQPEDFDVTEQLPFDLSGEGEHHWLYIEKRGCNTDWVAKQLADFAEVPYKRTSYAGLKDRHAVTRQWFSVNIPGKREPDWQAFEHDEIRILEARRHGRKLQRGALKANDFVIRLRDLEGDRSVFQQRCETLARSGVPNYFGEQRFGRRMQNLVGAHQLFSGDRRLPRQKRSLYLSAARSLIFNEILAERIALGSWCSRMEGDVFMLEGSNACFGEDGSPDIDSRLSEGDLHPTAAMWGKGDSMALAALAALEEQVAGRYQVLAEGLCKAGMKQQRRAARVLPVGLRCDLDGDDAILSFSLPSGSYATAVLAELCELITVDSC